MRLSTASIGAIFLLCAPAFAQNSFSTDPVSNSKGVLPNFDIENIKPVLDELGVQSRIGTLPDGERFLNASHESGLNFVLHPRDCRAGTSNCLSLISFAFYSTDEAHPHNPQTVSAFNAHTAAVGTFIDSDGDAVINRFDLASYGVTRGTLSDTVIMFVDLGIEFYHTLYSSDQTVAVEGDESDLAANYLNARTLISMTQSSAAGGVVSIDYDETYAPIADLKASGAVRINKIRNVAAE